jgi:hypothetical protein
LPAGMRCGGFFSAATMGVAGTEVNAESFIR